MHIAIVNQWYPPDYGGVAVYNAAMARAYVDLGQHVTVITAKAHSGQPDVADDNGIRIRRVRRRVEPYRVRGLPLVGRHVRSLRHLAYSRQACTLLERLARRETVDVVEFAEINAEGWFAAVTGIRIPVVVRCHTPHFLLRETSPDSFANTDTTIIERAEAMLIRRARAVSAPSRDLARRVESALHLRPGRIDVIPNAIDVAEFAPAPTGAPAAEQRPLTILHVGRLSSEKGIFVLADALVRLAGLNSTRMAGGLPWRVVFAGDDRTDRAGASNKTRLARFFSEHGLSDRVELRGFVGQERLVDLYHQSDLCVVPSILYESFSYTCLQAMACGLPLIATTMGGIPEVVAGGETGLLVPPGDSAALADALMRLLDSAELRQRLGGAGRRRALRLYSHVAVAKANLALYERIA